MKLYATITTSKGKKEGLGDNEYLEVDCSIGNKTIGRVIMGLVNGDYLITYYPVGETGRTILYSSGWKAKAKGELCAKQGHEIDEFGYCKNCDIKIV